MLSGFGISWAGSLSASMIPNIRSGFKMLGDEPKQLPNHGIVWAEYYAMGVGDPSPAAAQADV